MTKPALSDATPPPPGQCSYENADGTTCDAPAAWHGITLEPEPAGLESCDGGEHLSVMADVAQWIHPWTAACGDDNSGFDPATNQCRHLD